MGKSWGGFSSLLRGFGANQPKTYEAVAAKTLDIDKLTEEKNKQLVLQLDGCLEGVVVKIQTESHIYEVHNSPRTTIEFYGVHPIDSDEYDAILNVVETATQGAAFGQSSEAKTGNSDVTRRHIGLQQKLSLPQIVDIIKIYHRMIAEMQTSPDNPIKSISIGPARFSSMKDDLYKGARLAGFDLELL